MASDSKMIITDELIKGLRDGTLWAQGMALSVLTEIKAEQDRLSTPTDGALREALILIDEINERKPSREFYGVNQTLHSKLLTIRLGLVKALASTGGDGRLPPCAPDAGKKVCGDTVCHQCGCANPVWFADNALWNATIGGPDATEDPGGILCPTCFIARTGQTLRVSVPDTGAGVVDTRPSEQANVRESLEALIPSNLGEAPTLPDDAVIPVDMTMGEIRRARAALSALPQDGWNEGVAAIAAERQRQINEEGWTPEHDDSHDAGQFCAAAACYALSGYFDSESSLERTFKRYWPWGRKWWKPKDKVHNLERAGALIAAEIDRLSRLPTPPQGAET